MANIDLPQSVLDLVEFHPLEDILLAILREGLPDVRVQTLIEDEPVFPFVLVRRIPDLEGGGDERFIEVGRFSVEVFTEDPDGDEKGSLLGEAARVILRNAWRSNKTIPGLGTVVHIRKSGSPHRETDWATSAGPVQYADLPTGTWRYEAQYVITVRRPL